MRFNSMISIIMLKCTTLSLIKIFFFNVVIGLSLGSNIIHSRYNLIISIILDIKTFNSFFLSERTALNK